MSSSLGIWAQLGNVSFFVCGTESRESQQHGRRLYPGSPWDLVEGVPVSLGNKALLTSASRQVTSSLLVDQRKPLALCQDLFLWLETTV